MEADNSNNQNSNRKLILILLPVIVTGFFLSLLIFVCCSRARKRSTLSRSVRAAGSDEEDPESYANGEDLIRFEGGGDLSISDILDAPGEVIGKSSYGTLYEARPAGESSTTMLLRFLRPACCVGAEAAARVIGAVRGENLIPMRAVYVGPRGEKLLVYPFYARGNLAQFIKDGDFGPRRWEIVYNISYGIVKGVDHLHTGLQRPMIHGNLKSKNVLLDQKLCPYISDYGLYLLLNATSGQEMLEASGSQGYRAPELMKIKDVSEATDIYSLGVVLLELLTGKNPINVATLSYSEDSYLPSFIRTSILHHRISDLYHSDLLLDRTGDKRSVTEDRVLKMVQLAVACCSPSPSFRPHIREVRRKIEEIGKQ